MPQIGFEMDAQLAADVQDVVDRVPGLKKSDLGRVALREKVREIKEKLANGEQIAISI